MCTSIGRVRACPVVPSQEAGDNEIVGGIPAVHTNEGLKSTFIAVFLRLADGNTGWVYILSRYAFSLLDTVMRYILIKYNAGNIV